MVWSCQRVREQPNTEAPSYVGLKYAVKKRGGNEDFIAQETVPLRYVTFVSRRQTLHPSSPPPKK